MDAAIQDEMVDGTAIFAPTIARARVEAKAVETVLNLRRHLPRRVRTRVPSHLWHPVGRYGLLPTALEWPRRRPDQPSSGPSG